MVATCYFILEPVRISWVLCLFFGLKCRALHVRTLSVPAMKVKVNL